VLFWSGSQESFVFFLFLEIPGEVRETPGVRRAASQMWLLSVRILKLRDRSDLPASAGQEKAWLPQHHLATTASAAFGHRLTMVQFGSNTQMHFTFFSNRKTKSWGLISAVRPGVARLF